MMVSTFFLAFLKGALLVDDFQFHFYVGLYARLFRWTKLDFSDWTFTKLSQNVAQEESVLQRGRMKILKIKKIV